MKTLITILVLMLAISNLSAMVTDKGKVLVNGDTDIVAASGVWQESHEGVGLICLHMTTLAELSKRNSEAVCFLTEVQALAKDSVVVSRNGFSVQTWDKHRLTAVTHFYADKTGTEVAASAPNAIHVTEKLVIDLDSHSVTKYVEFPTKTLGFHLLID